MNDYEAWLKKVFEWDGTFWKVLDNEMCTKKVFHTTVVYGGAIYHAGKQYTFNENDAWMEKYNK